MSRADSDTEAYYIINYAKPERPASHQCKDITHINILCRRIEHIQGNYVRLNAIDNYSLYNILHTGYHVCISLKAKIHNISL